MQVTQEKLEKSQVKLTITLTVDEMKPFEKKATQALASRINIPGFRVGHVPLEVVREKVGAAGLYEQAVELAVRQTLPKAIEQETLETVGEPIIGVEKMAPGNDFVFTATLPILPSVKMADIKKIEIEKEEVKVTDEDINKVIDELRKYRASEVLVDRAAAKGDKVDIDFNVFQDNVPIDGGTGKKYPLELGSQSMIPGFEEQVEGMKKGETKEFTLKFPKEYHQQSLAGKECTFKVTLNDVFEIKQPELNADFAKQVGNYDSVEVLKKEIAKNLEDEKKHKAEDAFERTAMEKIVDASTFGDVPDIMMTRETQLMMQELEQNLQRQGMKIDDYLSHLKKSKEQLTVDMTPQAMRRIKAALIIRNVAKDEKIEVSAEELQQEIDRVAESYKHDAKLVEQVRSKGYREYQEIILRNRKAIDWVKANIKVKK